MFDWTTRTEHYPDTERISKDRITEHLPCRHAPCSLLYTTRQPLGAQRLERCGWSITRTNGVGLCQPAAGGPLLRYTLSPAWCRGGCVVPTGLVRTRTRTRARTHTALLVERDSMAARGSLQSHHTAVAAAAAASAAERIVPTL